MRPVRCLRGLFALLVIGLGAGCDVSPDQAARDVCTAFCDCAVTPGLVEQCVVEGCLPDLPPVSDACLQCVYMNSASCTDLFADCSALCQ